MPNNNDFADFINQVKRANDIVDVIGGYITVKQRGQNWWACCPFHTEKTASFSISRTKQFYKCFGCGETGDVIKFVQKYESIEFMEALEILAKRAGLKMPETTLSRDQEALKLKKEKRDEYLSILTDTARFYFKALRSPRGEDALGYVTKRGFSTETARVFGLGFSPDNVSLVTALTQKHSLNDCLTCGVVQQGQSGRVFDALFNRLIVPIFDSKGQVIAFGGRALSKEQENYGKYKNTSDTPVFLKQNVLFGENLARKEKRAGNLKWLLVVEGYMDVIALYQAGFTTTVASMGTSLTQKQAHSLKMLNDAVYICYDGDSAGQNATIRGMDILKGEGLEVYVVTVPDNLDPDEYIKAKGKDAFEQLLKSALPLNDYKVSLLDKTFPDVFSADSVRSNAAKVKYAAAAVALLRAMNTAERKVYVSEISRVTGYTEGYLMDKCADSVAPQETEFVAHVENADAKALLFVARSLLFGKSFAKLDENPVWCQSRFLRCVFDYLFDCKAKGASPQPSDIFNPQWGGTKEETFLLTQDFDERNAESDAAYFAECANALKAVPLKLKRAELLEKVKTSSETDVKLLNEIDALSEKIAKLIG